MSYMGIQELKDADLKSGSATGDGSTTTFAIGWTPPSEQSLFVTINGVLQSASALSISGANCVFTAAPASGDAIEFKGIQSSGTVVTTTGDGTIDAAKLADNAVTSAKILDDAVTIAKLAATGTAQAGTYLQGNNTWGAISATGFEKYTLVTSTNATFALTSGVTKVVVEVQASGGDAGNNSGGGDNGGSGGAGAYARKLLTGMTGATDQLNITLGAVPGAATAGTTTSVAAAGTASFTTITCTGGAGGPAGAGGGVGGGAGGALPTTGDVNIAGQNGTPGAAYGNAVGKGADSWLGFGGRRVEGTNGTGASATGYGAGGGQGRGASGAGGGGGPACVIVWEYK